MKYPLLFISILFSCYIFGQSETSYHTETFGSLSTGENTPFWMTNQKWGVVPLNSNNFYLRGAVFHEQKLNKDYSLNFGADLIGSTSHSFNTIWIQQLYGEFNWKKVRLNIGSKEDYRSLLNPILSSGDFTSSNNARPLPEIKLSIPDFVLFPGIKRNFYIKGDFSVGKYLDGAYQEDTALPYNQTYTKDVLSHYKSVYFRFGNIEQNNKLQFIFGLDHHVQWGGTLYKKTNKYGEYDIIKQPKTFEDFMRAVTAQEGSANSSPTDQSYVAGSHIGSYLFKLDYCLNKDKQLSLYTQHFFEDRSGFLFQNYKDMLLGIEYKTKEKALISNVLFEYIYTKNQSGPIHYSQIKDEEHKHIKNTGNDNYYNNNDYIQGPSHYGRTKGTPLFLSPEYNNDGYLNFKGTRIIAFHMGVSGYISPDLQYRILATTGQNWGRYFVPYTSVKKGVASQLDLTYNYPKTDDLSLKLSMGFNTGKFFSDDTFGIGFTIIKKGIIQKRK